MNIDAIDHHLLLDNPTWQKTCKEFCNREIKAYASDLIDALYNSDDPPQADILNTVCFRPEWSDTASEHSGRIYTDERLAEDYCIEHDLEPAITEALAHYIVSEWLALRLRARGELVAMDYLGMHIWGRTTCGQHPYIDTVISKICLESKLSDTKTIQLLQSLKK